MNKKKLTELIMDDLVDCMLDDIIVLEVDVRNGVEHYCRHKAKIEALENLNRDNTNLLAATRDMAMTAINDRRSMEDLYRELKVLYDARVTQDIMVTRR